jgi:hypothetical protein
MGEDMNEKLEKAVQYLRDRGIYILDAGNKFLPTDAAHTDIAVMFARYRREVLDQPFPAVMRKRK